MADRYGDEFRRLGLTDRIGLPAEPYRDRGLTNHHIYHQYVIRTPQRDALREHLTGREIGTAIYYPLALHERHEGVRPFAQTAGGGECLDAFPKGRLACGHVWE